MILKKIKVQNFRNFEENSFDFNPFLTIIIGENARGKTNLLEGIYFITNGVGFREKKEEELILFNKDKAIVEGNFGEKDEKMIFQIALSKNNNIVSKNFFINKVKKKSSQYLEEQTKSVLFSPEQILVIAGSPDLRRSYFNKLISSYDYEYKRRVVNYESALRKRNKIFEIYQNEIKLKEELVFWNNYLEEQADYIALKREGYIKYLNENKKIDSKEFEIEYVKNTFNKKHLEEVFNDEKRWRQTLVGPQKDDFKIYFNDGVNKKNIHFYGSRSEQRMGIFWLKTNEVKYYENKYKKRPIVLLDDIFSELDMKNKKLVLDFVKKYQTIITTTEAELLDLIEIPKSIIAL